MHFEIEITEPGQPARRVPLTGPAEVGRQVEGVVLSDRSVSRRHLSLEPTADGVVATDLGSRSGTVVNGVAMGGPTLLRPGDWLMIGQTTLLVHESADATPPPAEPTPAPPAAPEPPPTVPPSEHVAPPRPTPQPAPAVTPAAAPAGGPGPGGGAPAPVRPTLEALTSTTVEGVAVIRYRPGTAGERAAPGVANATRRARKRLAGLGSEPWGVIPQICLVDPFPDPDRPGSLVTEGTVVDTQRQEIWMVVSSESPPEAPERPLAVLFGSSLPAGQVLTPLLEGYGLHLAKTPVPDDQLAGIDLPPLGAVGGELGAAMGLSFVAFLLEREGDDGLRRLLGTAQPDRLEESFQEVYGLGSTALEEAWREKLLTGGPKMKTGQFLRLSLRYLRPYKWKQAEVFLYMLFALAFTMVFPFVTRALFDTALPSGEFSQVATLLGGLGIAFVVSLLAGLRQAYVTAWISGAVVRDVRDQMFDKLQTLPTAWFKRHNQGDVLTRMFSDVMVVEQGLTSTLRDGLFQMLSLVVSAVVMLTINPMLGVIVLIGAPLVAVVYRLMGKGAQRRGLAVQEDTGSLMGVAAENYSAEPVVKLFGLQRREVDRFGRLGARLFRSERRLSLFGGLFGLSVNMIVTLLRIGILGLGAWLIIQGEFTTGGLVAFLGIMGEVLNPVTVLTSVGQQVQSASGALHRIDEVMDEAPEFDAGASLPELPPLSREITFEHVDFSYTSDRQVLTDVSAVIPAGTRVAFVGPSGSGKSTTLQLLMRLYDPDAGTLRFDGVDVSTVSVASLRSQLGVVFQESFLFDATVRENIALGKPGATDDEILAAARAAEVHDFIEGLPRGYDTVVGERGGLLSGGQRQRVAIARALIRNPRVLLLDEATSALDPGTERQITETLQRLASGRTTVAITHRLTSVTDYDRIFVIVAGRILEQGTHDELVALGGTYAQLWHEQTGAPVPTAGPPPFDPVAALATVPLFEGLDRAALDDVAGRLRSVELPTGQSIDDSGGRLVVVTRGRARVLVPGVGTDWSVTAELGIGDVFGLNALLGGPVGAQLQAVEPTQLSVLNDEAMVGIAATHPSVAAALGGAGTAPAAVPQGGQRLTRMTMALRSEDVARLAQLEDPEALARTEVARREEQLRKTGAFTRPQL